MANPLTALSDHVYYLSGGVNCVIVVNDHEAVIIDSGQDKEAGRQLKKACAQLNVTPKAIINTHSHADHYGGNEFLLNQFDLTVYAPDFEASIMQNPYLEPVYLFSGAKPLAELLNKWLLAKPSRVDKALEAGILSLIGLDFQVLDTSGHAHKQMSVMVDDVLIAADALFGPALLERYPLPFGQDIARQIASAESLRGYQVRQVLPGHGAPSADLLGMIDLNLATFEGAARAIKQATQGQNSFGVLKAVSDQLGIVMEDLPRYYLNHCVVLAYLSYLRERGEVELSLKDNEVVWRG
ncbi:MAG: MBL fold metallo-hydrolase [Deinococcales bacterium]